MARSRVFARLKLAGSRDPGTAKRINGGAELLSLLAVDVSFGKEDCDMSNRLFFILVVSGCLSTRAQTTPGVAYPNYPAPSSSPQAYSGQAYANYTNPLASGGSTFSNRLGQSFSTESLVAQLQNLRSVVDQTLPLIAAFNESYSNSAAPATRPTVGGALSGIVSDVLRRNESNQQGYSGAQNTFGTTNLLTVLRGLLTTNANGTAGAPPANAQDLLALQASLQPVAAILQRLNVAPAMAQPNPGYYNAPAPPNGTLTPTGR
jgi:hypothetical protein